MELTSTLTFVTETCCTCGVAFAMPRVLYNECKADTDHWFYCPNGHRQHYLVSTETKLRQELERAEMAKKRLLVDLELKEAAHAATKRQLRSVKGDRTRILNRVQNGVCPVCKRHFCDLERHMKDQHPQKEG